MKRLRAKDLGDLAPGWHDDGGGLRFRVKASGARSWVQRMTLKGRRVNRGLGPYPLVTLERARAESHAMRLAARDGRDLAQERAARAARATTFRQAFQTYFENKRQELEGSRHLTQWTSQMRDFVFPRIGAKAVGDVTHADILGILEPVWYAKPETAKRVLQRTAAVFKSAILRGQRERANPCDGVAQELGPRHQEVEHHRALPYAEVPALVRRLRASTAKSAVALEWLILTATRSGETRFATWAEIQGDRWVIPRRRMKGGLEHTVPLSGRCLEILTLPRRFSYGVPVTQTTGFPATATTDLLFPGARGGPMSDMTLTKLLRDWGLADRATVHGFRTSFRTWATETDQCREVVAEAALAHAVRDKVEAAYRRTSYLEERVGLMQRWADYCCT